MGSRYAVAHARGNGPRSARTPADPPHSPEWLKSENARTHLRTPQRCVRPLWPNVRHAFCTVAADERYTAYRNQNTPKRVREDSEFAQPWQVRQVPLSRQSPPSRAHR
eukprot:6591385-Prymnesium_polylepis.1